MAQFGDKVRFRDTEKTVSAGQGHFCALPRHGVGRGKKVDETTIARSLRWNELGWSAWQLVADGEECHSSQSWTAHHSVVLSERIIKWGR